MRKILVLLGIFSILTPFNSFAEEEVTRLENPSHFHLLQRHCKAEDNGGVDSSPQSPPLDVDDPGTPGCDRWEINVLVDGDLTSQSRHWETPLLDINYGVGDNWQLKYEVPMVSNQTDQSFASGVAGSKVGVKYKFYSNEETDLELAFYPQVEFVTPGSDAVANGLDAEGNVITLPFLVSKRLGANSNGDILFTGNLSYNISTKAGEEDFIGVAAGFGIPVLKHLALMSELSTEQALWNAEGESREQLIKLNGGFMGQISKNFLVYASVGKSLYSSDSLEHNYALAGIRLFTGNFF